MTEVICLNFIWNDYNISDRVNSEEGLEISHLLSGAKQRLQVSDLDPIVGNDRELIAKEQKLFPDFIKQETNPQKVFWWLWRCLSTAACKASHFPFTGKPTRSETQSRRSPWTDCD